MKIKLLASYFKDVEFQSDKCPIGLAVSKQKKKRAYNIGYSSLAITDKAYDFPVYNDRLFKKDERKAKRNKYSEDLVIREIELTPLKN
jgi:hypothetical protein